MTGELFHHLLDGVDPKVITTQSRRPRVSRMSATQKHEPDGQGEHSQSTSTSGSNRHTDWQATHIAEAVGLSALSQIAEARTVNVRPRAH